MKAAMRAVKNSVMQFEDIEVKVREATSSDRWGVTDSQMAEIARATNDYNAYPKLFQMLWKRLTDVEHVMHVQKALILVEYLLRYGSERFIGDARRRSRDIAALQKYKHYDEHNQDDAKEARAKAKVVNDLLSDEHRLQEERVKAAKLKENVRGVGSDDYGGGYGGPSGGGYGGQGANGGNDAGYDNPYNGQQQQLRAPQRAAQPRYEEEPEDDPYGDASARKAAAAPAAAMSEEELAAEKKRKKKEKKRREAEEAAAAAAAAGGEAPEDADDPFSSSVIPATVAGGAVAAAAPVPAPQENGEKKKKKKDKERSASTVPAGAAASASSQYAAMAAPQQSSGADVDLTSFADNGSRRAGGSGGDFDFLSGAGAPGSGDLADVFASGASITDQPTLWDQQAAATQDDFAQQSSQAQPQSQGAQGQKKDTWASDLFNLERLDQAPAQPKQKGVVEGGVSMSMMMGLNPNAAPTARHPSSGGSMGGMGAMGGFAAPQQQQQQQFGGAPQQGFPNGGGNPAFASMGGFAAPNPGYGQAPPPLGPQGYGGYGRGQPQMGGPMGGGMGGPMGGMGMGMGGYGGMPQQQQQMGYGGMQQQPQGGFGGGFGAPQQQQGGIPQFHVPQQGQQQQQQLGFGAPARPQAASLDPFASLVSQPARGGSVDFFVPAARK